MPATATPDPTPDPAAPVVGARPDEPNFGPQSSERPPFDPAWKRPVNGAGPDADDLILDEFRAAFGDLDDETPDTSPQAGDQ